MATIRHPIAEMKLYSVILCGLLCGCTLPPPLDVISLAKTTVDVILMVQDKPTTTDGMQNCQRHKKQDCVQEK